MNYVPKYFALVTAFVLSLSQAQASANFTHFQSYETHKSGDRSLEDLKIYELASADLKKHTFSFEIDGKKYEIGEVKVARITRSSEMDFEAEVILYDEGVPVTNTHGHLQGRKLSPIPLSLSYYLYNGEVLPNQPCLGGHCRNNALEIKRWDEAPTAAEKKMGFRGTSYRRSFQIKSIDYDWATGEWDHLILAETLYTEVKRPFIPNGGGTTVGSPLPLEPFKPTL